MIYLIGLVAYFILCQVIVVKTKKIIQFLQGKTSSEVTLLGMLVIGIVIIVCILLKLNWIVAALVTVFECTMISTKYRMIFENMERGEKS